MILNADEGIELSAQSSSSSVREQPFDEKRQRQLEEQWVSREGDAPPRKAVAANDAPASKPKATCSTVAALRFMALLRRAELRDDRPQANVAEVRHEPPRQGREAVFATSARWRS